MNKPPSSHQVLGDATQFHVLAVDDDTTILQLLKDVLSMVPGCKISTASNPADAMQLVSQSDVDIIFTDIHMPGVTGLEFLKDVIALNKTPEVIVMTAYPSGEISNQAMELGATSLMAKPFEDISLVEIELEKAIKRILRKRSAAKDLPAMKAKAAATATQAVDNDPVMKVSLDTLTQEMATSTQAAAQNPPAPSTGQVPTVAVTAPRAAVPPATTLLARTEEALRIEIGPRSIYPYEMFEPTIQIEIPRALRYNRPFAIGIIDIPEDFKATLPSEQEKHRQNQIAKIEKAVRRSDVLFDAGREGVAAVLFECNRLGAEVVEHKLRTSGFLHTGFRIFPTEAQSPAQLVKEARESVGNKRKFQIALIEAEEFFGRIIQNMLLDPKYFVNWVRSTDDAYKLISREAEGLKLVLISLTKDPKQWQLLIRLKKENLTQWPVILFVDISLTKDLKNQLRALGVRAVVSKAISHEEFLYIVQSFVLPRQQMDERKNFRSLVAVPVVYKVNGVEQSSNSFTLSKDGIFIRDMNPPSSGTMINLKMFIPGRNEAVETTAEVLYAVPYFVGVNRFHVSGFAARFEDLSPEMREQLDGFVSACLTTYLI